MRHRQGFEHVKGCGGFAAVIGMMIRDGDDLYHYIEYLQISLMWGWVKEPPTLAYVSCFFIFFFSGMTGITIQ